MFPHPRMFKYLNVFRTISCDFPATKNVMDFADELFSYMEDNC